MMEKRERAHQILFVDQNEKTCAAVVERLTNAGFQVISACCPRESLCLAKIGLFDLYLFGQLFPKTSSMELCRQIRAFDERTPILFYFGPACRTAREPAMAVGGQAHLKNLAGSDALEKAIAVLLPENKEKEAGCRMTARHNQRQEKVAIIVLGNSLDLEPVRRYVNLLPPHAIVMTNGPRGSGVVAETAARRRGLAISVLPIDWQHIGRRAGWWGNRRLLECADRIALFWDQRNHEALSLLRFAQKLRKSIEFYTLEGSLPGAITLSSMPAPGGAYKEGDK